MKFLKAFALALTLALMLTSCNRTQEEIKNNEETQNDEKAVVDAVEISLSDNEIKIDGVIADGDEKKDVYVANDVIYYESGKDFTYGEGTENDAHTADEASEHTVVHITAPGTYNISGKLTKGQIAVDLGDDAEENPDAVVTLILDGVDITCEVAPAVIFYNVYECASTDADKATKDVDTSLAGANVIIADGSKNTVNGSYVARIYKPDSIVLNEDGTEVEDAKKLHKYDAAFYSKMTMKVGGGIEGNGVLTINAENEGLDSELHLTINGGIININSGNDGINTNEDGVSVTTINGGEVNIKVTGETGEGDGIDSNGWLVINGGKVYAEACAVSGDAGIDSDMGIHINGGEVIASGNMLDRISESEGTYAVMNFNNFLGAGTYTLKNSENVTVLEKNIENRFTILILSSESLTEGDYTLWYNGTQLAGAAGEGRGKFGGGMRPEGMTPPELPEDFDPEKMQGNRENMTPPDFEGKKFDFERNEDGTVTLPDGTVVDPSKMEGRGDRRPEKDFQGEVSVEVSEIFTINEGENYFNSIRPL